jgi:hypothetical protein
MNWKKKLSYQMYKSSHEWVRDVIKYINSYYSSESSHKLSELIQT